MPRISLSHVLLSRRVIRALLAIIPTVLILGVLNSTVLGIPARQVGGCGPNNVGGRVYHDYNASGVRDVANPNEPGVAGVTVTAYNEAGAAIDTTPTAADGSYVLSVPDGTSVRVEFTNFPAGYLSGPFGAESVTTVGFLSSPSCSVHLGLGIPSQYCQNNPGLATNCFLFGDQAGYLAGEEVLVSFPYSAGGTALPAIDTPPHDIEARANQIGTTWGLGYQRASDSIFAAAYLKRHAGLGPLGSLSTGAVYRASPATPGAIGSVSLFLDVNIIFGAGTAGVITRTTPMSYEADPFAWDAVGKIALGDLDVAEDDVTIWLVNLNDRQLYEIPIGNPPAAPLAGSIGRFPVPSSPPGCPDPAVNVRPFGLAVNNGLVYVGMVCSAETTQNVNDLRAYVYSFNPATDSWSASPVLTFPLNYTRRCVDSPPSCTPGPYPAAWRPWRNTFIALPNSPPVIVDGAWLVAYPEPMLADLAFDNGDLIVALRDRYADQVGYIARSPSYPADPNSYSAIGAGDILRACASGPGAWTLENNANCGSVTTAGASNGQGPGNGEYYFGEDHPFHDEISMGGIFQVWGYSDTVVTAFDPVYSAAQLYDGGALWLNDRTGARTKAYRVFDGGATSPLLFGKANGLGDIEAMCRAAPLEIGNRVWRDKTDLLRNGLQDAENPAALEFPIPNVSVRLYSVTGTLLAQTTTSARGEYYFNASNVSGGIQPSMTYTIRLDNPANYALGGPLNGLTVTLANAGGNDAIDSDGVVVTDYPEVTLVTGGPGANNHTFDFGFHNIIPTAVELLYFRAEDVSGRQVSLAWATAAEIDNFGFNLYRSATGDFASAQFVHFEPAMGGRLGATYAFVDAPPSSGTWFYWLVDVDTAGREGTPVVASATLDGGDDAEPTPAPTAVPPVAGPTSAPPAGPVAGGATSPPGGQAVPIDVSGSRTPVSEPAAPAPTEAGDSIAMLPPEPSPQAAAPGQPQTAGVAEAPQAGAQPPVAESQAAPQPAVAETDAISEAPAQTTNVDPAIPLVVVVAGAALGLALILLRRKARGTNL